MKSFVNFMFNLLKSLLIHLLSHLTDGENALFLNSEFLQVKNYDGFNFSTVKS